MVKMKIRTLKCYIYFIFIIAIFMVIFIENYLPNQVDKKLEPRELSEVLEQYLFLYKSGISEDKIYDLLDEEDKIVLREYLKEKIKILNEEQKILNMEKFEPFSNDTLIILVQVHKSWIHLKYLIESLRSVLFIGKVFIVFSHDFFSFKMNYLIRNIKFCRVMQIFYPYSLQVDPYTYPVNGNNNGSDILDKNRLADLSQDKLHWWWSVNTVFDKLNITKDFQGFVMFLEENNYVSPDLVSIYEYMKIYMVYGVVAMGKINYRKITGSTNSTKRKYSKIIQVTRNNKKFNYTKCEILRSGLWSAKIRLGLTIDRDLFNVIKKYSYEFCTINNSSWSNTLLIIVLKNFKMILECIYPFLPRVFQLEKVQDSDLKIQEVLERSIENIKERYFEDYKRLINKNYVHIYASQYKYSYDKKSVNWGNPRDQNLCLNISSITVSASKKININ